MKKNYFSALPIKLTAWILMAAVILAGIILTFGVVVAMSADYYSQSAADAYESRYEDTTYYSCNFNSKYDFDTARSAEAFLYGQRYTVPWLLAVAVLTGILLFVYLIWSAGRHPDGNRLTFFGVIPYDVLFTALGGAALLAGYIAIESNDYSISFAWLYVGALLIDAAALLFVLLCVTFAARCRNGGIFKKLLTFIIIRGIFRLIVRFFGFTAATFKKIPYSWQPLLGCAAYMLVSMSLLLPCNGLLFFLWLVVSLALVVYICWRGWMFSSVIAASEKLAAGMLDYRLDVSRLRFGFRGIGENLNRISEGMSAAVDERMKSERFKTELITNVSHDIKTPLTSIINYADLLGREELNNPRADEYVAVITRQAQRLRKLTEDIVEASKASSGTLKPDMKPTAVNELLSQCAAEYGERFEAAGLIPVLDLPENTVTVNADGRLLWRVLDNLLSNACKYSLNGTRVYLSVDADDKRACISVRSISREPLNISADELMERFVRGDRSRNTEGSGLGLSIARSITELMGGEFGLSIDGDLFRANIRLPLTDEVQSL